MMENRFLNGLMNEQSRTLTENGASAMNTAGAGAVLDLFAVSGSLRSRPETVDAKFAAALAEDRLLSAKLAFYTRDIRGGLGEREAARRMFRILAVQYPDIMRRNLALVPEYGRWDDVIGLMDTPVCDNAVLMIAEQLSKDLNAMKEGRSISLLAKWMPSVNTSSEATRRAARRLAKALGMSERTYRKTLAALRSYLNVTEVRMTEKDYENIEYASVPSYAMRNYRQAFRRNDAKRFGEYLASLEKGETVIRAATLYPYDIVEKYTNSHGWGSVLNCAPDPVLEEQWKALPNYIEGENNFLIMVDVSGSMIGRPIATSVGLGIYFAERNKGAFRDTFMTFTSTPKLMKVSGSTLHAKVQSVFAAGVGYNTDLEAAFDLVLRTAVKNRIPQEEMPVSLIVISDGEIDRLRSQTHWGFVDEMKQRFADAGYVLPNLVLWNVDSRQDTYHASGFSANVQLCSGQSASVFKALISGVGMTPYEYMLSVLNDPRYEAVTV